MISAHMDEVGMIVTDITSDGMLRFAPVGGIDSRVMIGRSVLVGDGISGVIGTKAMHMQTAEERGTAVKSDQLFIDIGAEDKEDAQRFVSRGKAFALTVIFWSLGTASLRERQLMTGSAVLLWLS